MTAKRFTVVQGYNDRYCQDLQTNELLNQNRTVELLNHLHEENQRLKHRLAISEKANFVTALEEENKQLKTTIKQLRTDNTKQKKKLNTTMKENEHIKQTIKDMINTERTELGQSVLRQLWEAIQ